MIKIGARFWQAGLRGYRPKQAHRLAFTNSPDPYPGCDVDRDWKNDPQRLEP